MRKVWIIARHEYLTNLRRVGFIVMTALVPVLGAVALIVGTLYSGQAMSFLENQFAPERGVLGLVDTDGRFTPVLPAYADQFQTFENETAGRDALEAESIVALVVIPANYLETGEVKVVTAGRSITITELGNSDSVEALIVDTLLRDEQIDPAVRDRILAPVNVQLVSLEDGEETDGRGYDIMFDFMVPYFFGILLFVSVFASSGYLMRGVSEEKTNRVIEIIISSVSARELLAGKVLGLGALGLTQIGIWMLSVLLLSNIAVGMLGVAVPLFITPQTLILSAVYYILGFLLYAVLMGAGGSLGTTMQESQQIAGIFSMVAALPMMLMGFIISNPNALLARIFSWFPLTAPTMMLVRMPLVEVPVIDIVGSILTVSLSIPLVLWAGAKIFRAGLLMYGKRATLRDIWQILQGA